MSNEVNDSRTLAAIGALVVEMFARQVAILGLLRAQPGLDENAIRKAVKQAHEQLAKIPGVSTLRSQASGQRLEDLEKHLRTIMFPSQS